MSRIEQTGTARRPPEVAQRACGVEPLATRRVPSMDDTPDASRGEAGDAQRPVYRDVGASRRELSSGTAAFIRHSAAASQTKS